MKLNTYLKKTVCQIDYTDTGYRLHYRDVGKLSPRTKIKAVNYYNIR